MGFKFQFGKVLWNTNGVLTDVVLLSGESVSKLLITKVLYFSLIQCRELMGSIPKQNFSSSDLHFVLVTEGEGRSIRDLDVGFLQERAELTILVVHQHVIIIF